MSEQRKDTIVLDIDDLMTAIKICVEKCNCILDILGPYFDKDTLDDDAKVALLVGYNKCRILLEIATEASADALDNLEHWSELYPRLKNAIGNTANSHPHTREQLP